MSDFTQAVNQAIAYASMCWNPHPAGVFDSTQATVAVDKILAAHKVEIRKLETELAAANAALNRAHDAIICFANGDGDDGLYEIVVELAKPTTDDEIHDLCKPDAIFGMGA